MKNQWAIEDTCANEYGSGAPAAISTEDGLLKHIHRLTEMSPRLAELNCPSVGYFWFGISGQAVHLRFLPPLKPSTAFIVAPLNPLVREDIRYLADHCECVDVRHDYLLTVDQALDVVMYFDEHLSFPTFVRLARGEVWWPETQE